MKAAFVVFLFIAAQLHVCAQPANDLFENRTALSGTNVSAAVSFAGATLDAGPDAFPFAMSDVWYSWTAPANGSFKVEANDDGGYPYDIRIYTGNDLSVLTKLYPFQSENVYAVDAGISYTVRLVRYFAPETYQLGGLDLQFIPAVTNDLFEDRIQLIGDSVQWEAWSPDATYNPGEPFLPELGANDPVTWWKWTAPADGQVFVQGNNERLMIFEGDELTNLVRLPLFFEAVAGREYQIAVIWVFSADPITLSLSLYRYLPYSGMQPGGVYPHFPPPTIDFQDFAESGSITNFTASVDGITLVQTNRLVRDVTLPILAEGIHSIAATAQSSLGFNYVLKSFDFNITHPNSSFTNRIALDGDVVTFEADFRGVTGSLWWSWTAPFSGQVTFEDLDQIGIRLDLFSGSSQDQLSWIETQRVQQGVTYVIRGSGLPASSAAQSRADGSARLRLFPVPPLNDNFSNASAISGNQFSVWICVSSATTEPGEPVSIRGSYTKTLWYSFVPPTNGLFTVIAGAGTWNWDVTIFTGASLGSLHEIKRANSTVSQYPVQSGELYYIRIQSTIDSPEASEVSFQFNSPPVNDNFLAATALSGDQTHFTAEMNAATAELGEPGYSTNLQSVWWLWTPKSSGFASLSIPSVRTNNISYPTDGFIPTREVFRGDTLARLVPVACFPLHEEVIGFSVEAGASYSIRLSYSSLFPVSVVAPFEVNLSVGQIEFISPTPNSVFVLPAAPQFQFVGPTLTNSTTEVELVEQTGFYMPASGVWEITENRGTAVWPDFTLAPTNFPLGRNRVFARAQTPDGTTIYSPPLDFFVLKTVPLRVELSRTLNQPQYLSLRELSNQPVIVESSSDLKTWVPETVIYQDSAALIDFERGSSRFYRSTLK